MSPLRIALLAGALAVSLAFVPVAWHMLVGGPVADDDPPGTPWQVARPAPGRTQVFGLDLPGSTLAEVRRRFGDELALALIDDRSDAADRADDADRDSGLALEAYVERFSAAGVAGRLLLVFDVDRAMRERWRDRLPATPTASGARRHRLDAVAAAEADGAPLVGVGLLPAASLDAEALRSRFGAPAQVVTEGPQRAHWLYPELGLAILLDAQGRDLLQYVAPGDFERRLAAPLRAPGR
jgi:hypothetical protein